MIAWNIHLASSGAPSVIYIADRSILGSVRNKINSIEVERTSLSVSASQVAHHAALCDVKLRHSLEWTVSLHRELKPPHPSPLAAFSGFLYTLTTLVFFFRLTKHFKSPDDHRSFPWNCRHDRVQGDRVVRRVPPTKSLFPDARKEKGARATREGEGKRKLPSRVARGADFPSPFVVPTTQGKSRGSSWIP